MEAILVRSSKKLEVHLSIYLYLSYTLVPLTITPVYFTVRCNVMLFVVLLNTCNFSAFRIYTCMLFTGTNTRFSF